MRILYVENHEVFAANVIRQFLSRHSVTVAPSLSAARQALVTGSFDLLLVDYDLDEGLPYDGIGNSVSVKLVSNGEKQRWQRHPLIDGDKPVMRFTRHAYNTGNGNAAKPPNQKHPQLEIPVRGR